MHRMSKQLGEVLNLGEPLPPDKNVFSDAASKIAEFWKPTYLINKTFT